MKRRLPALVAVPLAALALLAPFDAFASTAGAAPEVNINEIEAEVMCPVCGTLLELAESPQAQREKAFIARLIGEGCVSFNDKCAVGIEPIEANIKKHVDNSLMLVTALAPVIGYDKASQIAHHAMDHDLTLKQAALQLGLVDEQTFDRVVDPTKMVQPGVAAAATG